MSALTDRSIRVALFADCFFEVNGVAHTCRHLAAFAASRALPLLIVHAGPEERVWTEGSVTHVQFRRGFPSLRLDVDMAFDLAFAARHCSHVGHALDAFTPDIVHLTGPGDSGLLGLILAHRRRLPVLASWHTNIHEYAARRLPSWIPARQAVGRTVQDASLRLIASFYRYARRTVAPNPELVTFLASLTGKPCGLMERGVDTTLFHPAKRVRECDDVFRIGYVGRLSAEKNIRWLVPIHAELASLTTRAFHFCLVGQGDEQAFLRRNLPRAIFRGVLHGEALARAFADFDAFVFPSETDTYGNVVLEALASGVPVLVTHGGGPKHIVAGTDAGLLCSNPTEFAASLKHLMSAPSRHAAMRAQARRSAISRDWDAVCTRLHRQYELTLLPTTERVETFNQSTAPTPR